MSDDTPAVEASTLSPSEAREQYDAAKSKPGFTVADSVHLLRAMYPVGAEQGAPLPAPPEWTPPALPAARQFQAQVAELITDQFMAKGQRAPDVYYQRAHMADGDVAPERGPLPEFWTRDADADAVEATLATTLDMHPDELRSFVDEGFTAARLLPHEAPVDPEQAMTKTLTTLRAIHGDDVETRIDAAKQALAAKIRAQPNGAVLLQRVVKHLDDTGLGNSPRLILRVLRLAEGRERA